MAEEPGQVPDFILAGEQLSLRRLFLRTASGKLDGVSKQSTQGLAARLTNQIEARTPTTRKMQMRITCWPIAR